MISKKELAAAIQVNVTHWFSRKESLPDDGVVCVFHVKHRKAYNLCYGYFFHDEFIEREPFKRWKKTDVDYWMPVPVLPEKDHA